VLPLALLLLATASACVSIASPTGWADPVFDSGTVYYSPTTGKLEAYDLSSHKVIWDFPNQQSKNIKTQAIYSTPVVDAQSVYCAGYDGNVYALDRASGQPRWTVSTGAPIIGGLLLKDGVLYVGNSDGHLVAVQATSGQKLWQEPAGRRVWSTPVDAGVDIVVTSMDRDVYAFSAKGHLDWKSTAATAAIASTPHFDSGRLTFGGFDKRYHAIDSSDGGAVWTTQAADNWFWTQGLLSGNTLYAGNLDGSVYAYDAANGDLKWHADLGAPIRSAPVLAGGALVVAARNGTIHGLDPANGLEKWSPISAGGNVLANLIMSPNNSVYAVTQPGSKTAAHLLEINPATGTKSDVIAR
jgi:outer membrane protein assembly factor BamB